MRDIALAAVLLGLLPLILYRPHVGILAWAWIAFMNPHREAYSFLQGANLNFVVALLTMVALVVSRERWLPRLTPTIAVMALFVIWTSVTTYVALDFGLSYEYWIFNTKTFLLAFFVSAVIDRYSRIHALILVIVVSLGYWGTVSAVQTLASLGGARITGPASSMISDNNHLALALVLTLPLVEYIRHVSINPLVRSACMAGMLLMVVTILGTYSRGGLIALAAVLLLYGWRSKHRLLAILVIAVTLVFGLLVFPEKWTERMATIETAKSDNSFQQRIEAWQTAIRIGMDRPIVGAGFRATEERSIYSRYSLDEEAKKGWAVHNAYLQVLAEHGFVGLALYAVLVALAFLNCRWVRVRAAGIDHLRWLAYLASMLQIGFVGFAVGGLALSVAYYDVFIILIVVSSIIKRLARKELDAAEVRSDQRMHWLARAS